MTSASNEIARLIPHAGAMCLLEQVLAWDVEHIVCRAQSHRAPGNPLLDDGRLWSFCGVEYAAQAMAAHRALITEAAAKPMFGLLASVRELMLRVAWLDDIEGDLIVRADKLIAEDDRLLYRFILSSGARELASGRAVVVLRAGR